ncbi:MAG: molybdopterin-guanine dinucleotide biosynthesis protein A [Hydrogenophaga sp.]|jgi:molybdopterin-guanine dinucleotide biosynthesis protein A
MKTVIIVQARMTSTRLPGKVLLPLGGEPMLTRLVQRLRRVRCADAIVIATTTNASDDAIVALCEHLGVASHRGSEHDVLSRYAEAAALHQADVVVRVTSDCPLIDPALIDRLIEDFAQGDCDYVSNMLPPHLAVWHGFVAQSRLPGLLASWHDRTQGRQDALQDHQLGDVQRRAQSPRVADDLAGQRHAVVRAGQWPARTPAGLL